MTPDSVAIVGASLAGLSVLRELRAAGFTGPVTVIGEETHRPYDRPPLSKAFLHDGPRPDLALADAAELDELSASWLLGTRATGLSSQSADHHTVEVDGGAEVTAEAVVVATGARARTLPGHRALAGVHSLRTLDDAEALRRSLRGCARLVVIGAGFIGAEVASTAAARGADVTVVEAAALPLAHAFGDAVAASCAAMHGAHGVRLRTGVGVQGLSGSDRVEEVVLADGTRLPADAVVVGIGARPNTEWLNHPQIVLHHPSGGIRTDACGRTDVRGVYALGDCAAAFSPDHGEHHRSEHWTNATTQAKAVAAAIAGTAVPPSATPYMWSDQYGHRLQFAGHRTGSDTLRVVDGDLSDDSFVAVYERDEQVVAVFARDNARLFTRYRKQIDRARLELASLPA
ncbi:FAD-dependent oxidoreductase [Mycobacterium sp. Y57]|uniref:NAD(P)/FAD-dependent oxidoreductase n=1 Tax=Mycolicibacterium xanthum TaxID=2796469 RepID=UPI001C84A4D7|nr:FAD-dependent oxidoreductase [Mycolicibacterium xanthum]MBX7433390.1 FAD-dependent oxidoreductase [Mycolicibacterium xanthum]